MKRLLFDQTETIHYSELTDKHFIVAVREGRIIATIGKNDSGYYYFNNEKEYGESWNILPEVINNLDLIDCELLVYEKHP